jgi:hypothetical protein
MLQSSQLSNINMSHNKLENILFMCCQMDQFPHQPHQRMDLFLLLNSFSIDVIINFQLTTY